jgi:hypothetical protein
MLVFISPPICRIEPAYVYAVQNDIRIITLQLNFHKQELGYYPVCIKSMVPEFLLELPKDPGGNEYKYELKYGAPYIQSLGENGVVAGTGLSSDFASDTDWETSLSEI